MKVTVIGCGRWGSLIAWYLDRIGHQVTLNGRASSGHMQNFLKTRSNGLLTLPESVTLSVDQAEAVRDAEVIVLSVPSQQLRAVMRGLSEIGVTDRIFVLCMKGIEVETGKRLSEIAEEHTHPSNRVAVWLGPGHVQEFYAGVPNCMVIDSRHEEVKQRLVNEFSGELIRFYYGQDLIGNEIGGASKNVIGIAAGVLDGLKLGTLKGALMSRGTREVSRLMEAMGGNPFSAYGLCHLGDYEATVFSPYSHNRKFGECFVTGEPYTDLAEGYYTAAALQTLEKRYGVELPICDAVYRILYCGSDPREEINGLFHRTLKAEIDGAVQSAPVAPHGIFDTHAHYFDRRFDAEGGADAILREVMPKTVSQIINVGTNCRNSREAIAQAAKYNGMYAAIGIHPEDCHYIDYPELALEELAEMLGTPESRRERKIVALGEIGLDYHYENYGSIPMDKEKQKRFFKAQMEMAQLLELPVIVHDREAHGDCFEIVSKYLGVRGVFHSYSGSAEMARELVKRGWYISFSGTLTFKNAAKVREAALAVPRDRLLIETDAPYLAPHPMRGRLNHSGLLVHTAEALAELWNCSVQEAIDQTRQNAEKLFFE